MIELIKIVVENPIQIACVTFVLGVAIAMIVSAFHRPSKVEDEK